MEPAKKELQAAIEKTTFYQPSCHIYQNVVARSVFNQEEIKKNLVEQLTGPVRWTQTIQAMIADGAHKFVEVGPGKVLQGLVAKISKDVEVSGA
jgi:[acyl-carrier-protein] S-malonyltransferase